MDRNKDIGRYQITSDREAEKGRDINKWIDVERQSQRLNTSNEEGGGGGEENGQRRRGQDRSDAKRETARGGRGGRRRLKDPP